MKSSARFAIAAVLALSGLGVAAVPGGATPPKATMNSPAQREQQSVRQMRAILSASTYRNRGPGWTTRQVQRRATKRRNVLRNRKAHRGGRTG